MIDVISLLKQVPGTGDGFNDGWFTPSRTSVDPPIPYDPLAPTGDPDPTTNIRAIVSWLQMDVAAGSTPVTATTSINTAIQAPRSTSFSLALAVQQANALTSSINTAIAVPSTLSNSIDLALQAARTATSNLDVAINQARTTSVVEDLAIQIARSITHVIDTAISQGHTSTAWADAPPQQR